MAENNMEKPKNKNFANTASRISAIAAATNPKSVGIVRDAKINDANVISMMKFKLN